MVEKSLKILVVDDDEDAADSLAELFEMEGPRCYRCLFWRKRHPSLHTIRF